MEKPAPLADFVHFLKNEKAWWIVPLLAVVVGLVVYLYAFDGPSSSDFLYPTDG